MLSTNSVKHLLDIRQLAVFKRTQTRCGKFKPGQDESNIRMTRRIMWLGDWDKRVDYLPVEGVSYCQSCQRGFDNNDGQEEHELYGDKINER